MVDTKCHFKITPAYLLWVLTKPTFQVVVAALQHCLAKARLALYIETTQ